ncbi:MAG: PAS domain S-box protein [Proteobacteria bacterium]|nr:PAS domain S-box protein [Pseudomonadota bacterium]
MSLNAVRRGRFIILISVLIAMTGLVFDLSLPLGVAAGVPYIVLVLIAQWSPSRTYIYHMAVLGTVLTIVGYLASPAGGIPWVVVTNRALAIFAIWVTALLCARIQKDGANIRAVIDTAADGIISIDEQGVIRSFNQAAVSIFGHTAKEAIGNNVSILMPSPDRENHDGYIERFINTGEKHIIGAGRRVQARHKDGHVFPIYLNVSQTQQGRHTTFTGIIHDLTDEEARETQLRHLSYVVEHSPISIIITDADGNIEYANPRFKQITGYQEEVLGKNMRIVKSDNTPDDTYRELWASISSGHIWRGVLQNRKKNGELFWVSSTIVPVSNQDGDIDHYIAFNDDITNLREREDMLTHAMKLEAVGRMTNGIAHDFRNLLTVILGNLQLLQEGVIQKDSELIADALSAAHDGSDLIVRLLAFSRRKEQIIQTIAVNAFLQDLLRLLQRMVNDNVNISLILIEETITVKADPSRLESAILNLVTNAQDAMPEGGELTIATDIVKIKDQKLTDTEDIPPGNYVTISITDNGVGMNEDTRQHALEAFYSTKTSGTGLGLSMVNDFINASGGAIDIESSPGCGTTFTLWFPAIKMIGKHKNETEIETEVIDSLPTGTETILLVEDNDKVRVFAHRILTHLGYHIMEAADATEALEHIQQHEDIDLLFTDIVMPGEFDGIGLAKQACSQLPSLSVLLTTGMYSYVDGRKNPAMDYPLLAKPYTAKQLAQSIRNILDTGQLTD